jgi:anti-sigma factor RsiW
MNASEPTRDQLLCMAYVDGELDPLARAAFEQRLAAEADLRREVSAFRELELLARSAAPREPLEHEWAALAREPLQRWTLALGWGLAVLGGLGLLGYGLARLFAADAPPLLKGLVAALALGGALLFAAVLRSRLRTLALDPYRKLQR